MTALVVNGSTPFGAISNAMVDNLHLVNDAMLRLQAAVAAAASGYTGTAGAEYETGTNFGVAPDATPGQQGASWAYAVNVLTGNWATFWAANIASITALDNG